MYKENFMRKYFVTCFYTIRYTVVAKKPSTFICLLCHICLCIFCGSILSFVEILFSFVYGMVMYDNEFETKGNNI